MLRVKLYGLISHSVMPDRFSRQCLLDWLGLRGQISHWSACLKVLHQLLGRLFFVFCTEGQERQMRSIYFFVDYSGTISRLVDLITRQPCPSSLRSNIA